MIPDIDLRFQSPVKRDEKEVEGGGEGAEDGYGTENRAKVHPIVINRQET